MGQALPRTAYRQKQCSRFWGICPKWVDLSISFLTGCSVQQDTLAAWTNWHCRALYLWFYSDDHALLPGRSSTHVSEVSFTYTHSGIHLLLIDVGEECWHIPEAGQQLWRAYYIVVDNHDGIHRLEMNLTQFLLNCRVQCKTESSLRPYLHMWTGHKAGILKAAHPMPLPFTSWETYFLTYYPAHIHVPVS